MVLSLVPTTARNLQILSYLVHVFTPDCRFKRRKFPHLYLQIRNHWFLLSLLSFWSFSHHCQCNLFSRISKIVTINILCRSEGGPKQNPAKVTPTWPVNHVINLSLPRKSLSNTLVHCYPTYKNALSLSLSQ